MVSNALEVMENIAPRGIWLRLLPLVDRGNDWKAKHAVGRELYPDLQGGIDDVLEEYLLSLLPERWRTTLVEDMRLYNTRSRRLSQDDGDDRRGTKLDLSI